MKPPNKLPELQNQLGAIIRNRDNCLQNLGALNEAFNQCMAKIVNLVPPEPPLAAAPATPPAAPPEPPLAAAPATAPTVPPINE